MESHFQSLYNNLRIARLEEADVRSRTDHFHDLKHLILAHETMYPEIAKWFREKVSSGIRDAERVAFIGYLDEKPAVSAVVKRGTVAKFCHLHVAEGLRDSHLGEVFFSLMANEVRDLAQRIYFTLPESVWNSSNRFFHSFNFLRLRKASVQYRLFEEEFECDAAFVDVWRAVSGKLPKLCEEYSPNAGSLPSDLLMSINPQHVEQIFSGRKRYELRRKFSTKWLGHRLNIYATEPAMQLVGQATVSRVIRDSPEALWFRLGDHFGCSHSEFEQYTKGAAEIYAIELEDVTRFRVPVSRKELGTILSQNLVPPQSYCTLKDVNGWSKAVSIAGMLQGAFKGRAQNLWNALTVERARQRPTVVQMQMQRLLS